MPVPGPSTNGATFRYTPDTTKTPINGTIYLTSTGKSRNVMRTVKVGIRRQGFLDFLYMTDYEIVDPALSGDPSTCVYRSWQWNPNISNYGPNTSSCSIVYWTDLAVLNGPVHTNDGLYVCGNPTFNGDTDTYYNSPASQSVAGSTRFVGPNSTLNPLGCANAPSWNRNNDPASGPNLPFPPANTSIRNQADGAVGGTGCLYTGPTTITLTVSGNDGKMDVTSPLTRSTNAGCGPGTNLNLPANGVIYVQTVPTSTSDPNYSACTGAACVGDAKVSGTLAGQLTIASTNDIVIVGNTLYRDVPRRHRRARSRREQRRDHQPPGEQQRREPGRIAHEPEVDAAILALDHSFYVQNWSKGAPLGNLTINGVITQEFRGAVGTFSGSPPVIQTGYNKVYTYDTRSNT